MSQQKRFIETTEHYHHQQSHHQGSLPNFGSSLPNYSTIPIKVEPLTNQIYTYHTMESTRDNPLLTTAMAIPRSKLAGDYADFNYEYDQSQSPQLNQDTAYIQTMNYGLQQTSANSNAMWSVIGDAMALSKQEPFPMDDDDIFQVDKADLFHAPTLAELNEDTILGDLNIDDFILPSENSTLLLTNTPTLTTLQPHSFHTTTMPPQQLLQHHQHGSVGGGTHNYTITSTTPTTAQGIPIGRDALLFDEQTNTSSSPYDIYNPTQNSLNSSAAFSPGSQTSSNSPLLINSISPPPYILNNNNNLNSNNNNINNNNSIQRNKYTTLQELLKQEYPMSPDRTTEMGQSVPGPSYTGHSPQQDQYHGGRRLQFATLQAPGNSRLSTSAPANSSAAWEAHRMKMWQRREPRQHLLSTGSLAEAGSTSSIASTGGILSPEAHDFSHDEGYDDSDSDHYEDYSSEDSDDDDTPRSSGSKKERYFWQYNVQAKGPKGQRLVIKTQAEDPHVLNEVTDPVFSPTCSVRGIKVVKHSGKARKGDGNDLTPNPRKLHCIGKELDKLGRTINDMTPVSELPFNVRPKSRKEKNKLASRACRLKKKAQHEANKIKLYGLETEHKRLISGIADIKKGLAHKFARQSENTEDINQQIDQVATAATKFQIAGTSTDFVNKVLEKVKAGQNNGGLNEI